MQERQIFKPKFDKMYWWSLALCAVYMIAMTFVALWHVQVAIVIGAVDLLLIWVLVSPCFGYVELREETLFVKFGLILKREIPYARIRKIQKVRHWYSESIIALKNAMEHVDIRYNLCDVVSVSVVENDAFIEALKNRAADTIL